MWLMQQNMSLHAGLISPKKCHISRPFTNYCQSYIGNNMQDVSKNLHKALWSCLSHEDPQASWTGQVLYKTTSFAPTAINIASHLLPSIVIVVLIRTKKKLMKLFSAGQTHLTSQQPSGMFNDNELCCAWKNQKRYS